MVIPAGYEHPLRVQVASVNVILVANRENYLSIFVATRPVEVVNVDFSVTTIYPRYIPPRICEPDLRRKTELGHPVRLVEVRPSQDPPAGREEDRHGIGLAVLWIWWVPPFVRLPRGNGHVLEPRLLGESALVLGHSSSLEADVPPARLLRGNGSEAT